MPLTQYPWPWLRTPVSAPSKPSLTSSPDKPRRRTSGWASTACRREVTVSALLVRCYPTIFPTSLCIIPTCLTAIKHSCITDYSRETRDPCCIQLAASNAPVGWGVSPHAALLAALARTQLQVEMSRSHLRPSLCCHCYAQRHGPHWWLNYRRSC